MSGFLVRAALCLGLLLGAAAPAAADPPIWIVRKGAATVVLFGSVHLLPPGLAWRTPALDRALARADQLWFELPINSDSIEAADNASMRQGMLPPGQSLARLLSPEANARLARVSETFHLAPEYLDRMRPWMAEITVSNAVDARARASASEGVEEQIQSTMPLSLARRAFESPREQIGLLANAPLTDQTASLTETLRECEEQPDLYQRVVADWMKGDVVALEADSLGPLRKATPGLYKRLIIERNHRWLAVLRGRLKHRGYTVVVVGAGHLIGPDGLPAQLRAEGYSVEGP